LAKRAKSRTAARKVRDRWRSKQWYNIIAPDLFDRRPIGATLSDDPSKILGRTYEVTLQEVTGNFARGFVKLQFQITHTNGLDAHTRFGGHELTSDQVRRRTRRRRTKIDCIVDVQTKDGARLRLKPILVADSRIQTSQKYALRKKVTEFLTAHTAPMTFSDLVGSMISGDLNRAIQLSVRKIYPVRRRSIEIAKSHVLEHARTRPLVEEEEKDYDSLPGDEAAPEMAGDEGDEETDIHGEPQDDGGPASTEDEVTGEAATAEGSGKEVEEEEAIGEETDTSGEEDEEEPAEEPQEIEEQEQVEDEEEPAEEPQEIEEQEQVEDEDVGADMSGEDMPEETDDEVEEDSAGDEIEVEESTEDGIEETT